MAAGKVITGYSKPKVAKYNNADGVVTYTDGMDLARGVSVSMDITSSDNNPFYANNILAENESGSFVSGTATLTVDGLHHAAERFIMGLPEAGADGWTDYDDRQQIPNVGVGFIVRYMSDGVTSYTPMVLYKGKFNQPSVEAATQEENIDWQTQDLEFVISRSDEANAPWRSFGGSYATEAEAESELNVKLGISAAPVTP